MDVIKKFLLDEQGLTVVEYVVAAGLLVGVLTGVFLTLGDGLSAKITATLS